MERPTFITDQIYHVFNRGVEKRKVFLDQKDHFRFVHDLFEFNDIEPAQSAFHHLPTSEVRLQKLERKPRKLLVEILCFCLMPNHYHFLLRQLVDGGVTEFMRKIGTGYTNYFNTKYDRVGALFQGKFKAVHVEDQSHLLYLPHYIHLNPLDHFMPEWRDKHIKNFKKALKFLESYRWSSYLDFIKKRNFPSVTQRNFILNLYGHPATFDYKKDMAEWLKEMDIEAIRDVILE